MVVVCTLPLLAFVLAIGGVALGESFVAMTIALACGAMTASLGIATSAHVANTRRSLLASLLGAGAVGIGVTTWLAFGSELGHHYGLFAVAEGYFEAPLDRANVALLFVIPAYALATVLFARFAPRRVRLDGRLRGPESPHQALGARRLPRWARLALFIASEDGGARSHEAGLPARR